MHIEPTFCFQMSFCFFIWWLKFENYVLLKNVILAHERMESSEPSTEATSDASSNASKLQHFKSPPISQVNITENSDQLLSTFKDLVYLIKKDHLKNKKFGSTPKAAMRKMVRKEFFKYIVFTNTKFCKLTKMKFI